MNPELLERLEHCGNLPALPGVALRLIELGRDPDVPIGQLAEAINLDPALVAKVLRMTNSALYGRRRESRNLRQAVTLLGPNATLSLALSFSLVGSLREGTEGRLDYSVFWRRAMLAATCAHALGSSVGLRSRGQLFLAGLVQDIGMLALDRALPDLYRDIGEAQRVHGRLQQWEQDRLGSDHAEVGAWLLRYRKLPEYLQDAVAGSHDPRLVATDDRRFRAFVRCVAVSGLIADIWLRDDPARLTEAADAARSQLGSDAAALNALLQSVSSEIPEVELLFESALVSASDLDRVLEEAQEAFAAPHVAPMEEAEDATRALAPEEEAGKFRELRDRGRMAGALVERAALEQTLREEFEAAGRYHWPLSLALVELDDFEGIRAAYGRDRASKVLDGAVSRLFDYTRYSDVLARYGDRGIAIILPGAGIEASRSLCERIVQGFASSSLGPEPGNEVVVRASVGMVTHGEQSLFHRAEDLLSAGKRAVQAAKAAGGGRAAIYEPHMWH